MKNIKRYESFIAKAGGKTPIEEQLWTPEGSSYWNNTGVYQQEYDRLYKELVPNSGSADTLRGELIRAISRISYDWYNNGNINIAEAKYTTEVVGQEWIEDIDDEGEDNGYYEDIEEDVVDYYEINSYYLKFFNLLKSIESKSRSTEPGLTELVLEYMDEIYDGSTANAKWFDKVLNKMTDIVVWWCLNNPDQELPADYKKG
jgi:hypothetical protein